MSLLAKSLRLRLQLWSALVLLTIIAGFGGVMYQQARRTTFQRVDLQLTGALRYLDAALQAFPPHELEEDERPEPGRRGPPFPPGPPPRPGGEGRGPPHRPPRTRFDPRDRDHDPPPPFAHRPPHPPPHLEGPLSREELFDRLDLERPFGNLGPGRHEVPSYFAIWRADGTLLKEQIPPDIDPPAFQPAGEKIRFLRAGRQREATALGPHGTVIVVGQPMDHELAEVARFGGIILLAGGAALALGLAGIWFISASVLHSISAISATASSISATQLSGRIDTEAVELELRDMARVLNDAFARLEASFERQKRFSADASHELRTPLAILYTNLELALSRPRSTDEYRDTLEKSLQAAARMRALVEGLLILARADAGQVALPDRQVDLGQLVDEALAQHAAAAQEAGVQLQVQRGDSTIRVQGDVTLLSRVIANLVSNALRHTPAGGTVQISCGVERDLAVLSVSDTGSGIPPEHQTRIFERFYRADPARTRSSGGIGLGLAICKCVVEAHAGTVLFTSQPGEGTTFVIRLPVV